MSYSLDLPVLSFSSSADWEKWLAENHSASHGLWLRIFKKGSGEASVTYSEALDVALCFGWIDGLRKSYDESSFVQRFTPRRPKSVWSKLNTQHVERLTKAGKMRPAGLREVEAAKADGRWSKAYDSPSKMSIPEDFLKELSNNKAAEAFFKSLNRTNIYAIAWRLNTAKSPETRAKRIRGLLSMLAEGKKLYE
jgi:uncharacterized protein YdeI (YjbR/CyaY-like superfamily)